MDVGVRSKSKAWVNEFLFVRGMIQGPDSSPLYQYHVTAEEYEGLPAALRQSISDIENPTYSIYWAAAFCLYVAEKYRREYDGSSLSWSWGGFEKPLSIALPSQRHGEIVKKGLGFWKRPIRIRANGYDYLGSLFDEGGLPWRLIKSESHGFGRAVRGGVANYYRVKQFGGDMASVIANYGQYFPQTFRTSEKYLLIASIVEWLMGLAEAYPLASVDNPADLLDEKAPEWKKQSPLPVGEQNARSLINEWLKDAGKSRAEKKRLEADEKNYTCEHRLKGDYSTWTLETEVFLPAEVQIELEGQSIQSTRLEIAFYEGDSLLKRSGIAHGKVSDDRSKITVRINSRVIPVLRTQVDLPLTVQFLSNGQCVHACYFENSEVDYHSLPMIFVEDCNQLKLISTASTIIPAEHAVIRIPPELTAESQSDFRIVGEDQWSGQWVDLCSDMTLNGPGSKIILRFDPNATVEKPGLVGTVSLYNTLPNLVYRGWPRVTGAGSSEQVFRLMANGSPLVHDYQKNVVGSFSLSIEGGSGETMLRRKIGVIPSDLRLLSVPASANSAARVIVRSSRRLAIRLATEGMQSDVEETSDGLIVTMEPLRGRKAPERISIEVRDGISPGDPVVLRLPYPEAGAHLFDDLGDEVKGTLVSLDQLIEMSLTLTPRPDGREDFFVSLELVCQHLPNFRRYYPFALSGQSQRVSLFAFQEDIQQMLGTTTNQDAYVRIRVETDRILKQVDIVRYNARLDGPNTMGRFEVVTETAADQDRKVKVCGMRLDDPGATPVDVPERSSQGVGMGVFEVPSKMMKNGPWLLFPPTDSAVKFRPTVWVTDDMKGFGEPIAKTLHAAAKLFHPNYSPHVFETAIESMASDLGHSGWDYLRSLKEGYAELPLSAFESWKALVENPSTLAASVFRLEFDPAFCRRLSNELAVIWETVTVKTWITARADQLKFLLEQGVPEYFAEKLVDDRVASVASIVPCFLHLGDYLKQPRPISLQQAPYMLATMWFKDLRRNHADDQRWPEWFRVELTNWIHQQDLPAEIKSLPDVGFSRAVAYMPVFMAAVTAGRAEFTSLADRLPELRFGVRVLSDFDREAWYEPTYSLVLSNLLLESE